MIALLHFEMSHIQQPAWKCFTDIGATEQKMIKGRVNPATISEPEFCIFFTILNMNMYPIITNIIIYPRQTFPA